MMSSTFWMKITKAGFNSVIIVFECHLLNFSDTVNPNENFEKENLAVRDGKIAKAKLSANLCCFEEIDDKRITFQSNNIVFKGMFLTLDSNRFLIHWVYHIVHVYN